MNFDNGLLIAGNCDQHSPYNDGQIHHLNKYSMTTWTEDIETVLKQLGGKGHVTDIVDKIKAVRFFSVNTNFKGAVRVTLHANRQKFAQYGHGLWGLKPVGNDN